MGLRFRNYPSEVLEGRDEQPTHSFKIQSFSLFAKASIQKYSPDKFEVADYKWNLSVYPNGNKDRDGEGHISIYLSVAETSSLPAGWEVKAIFNFLLYDHLRDKYFTFSDGKIRRFHAMKTAWGIAKFIELDVFMDPSNGYLIDDACVVGLDIFVLKQTRKVECLSMTEEPATGRLAWRIKSFPSLYEDSYESDAFTVGDHKWRIRIHPNGIGEGRGHSVSVFLCLDESTLPPNTKLFVKYILRMMDPEDLKAPQHFEFKTEQHFGSSSLVLGSETFLSLAELNKNFLDFGTCTIEAELTLLGKVATAP